MRHSPDFGEGLSCRRACRSIVVSVLPGTAKILPVNTPATRIDDGLVYSSRCALDRSNCPSTSPSRRSPLAKAGSQQGKPFTSASSTTEAEGWSRSIPGPDAWRMKVSASDRALVPAGMQNGPRDMPESRSCSNRTASSTPLTKPRQ